MKTSSAGRVVALLSLPLLAGACSKIGMPGSAEYTCGSVPAGICASARDIYRMTDGRSGGMLPLAQGQTEPGSLPPPVPAAAATPASGPGPAADSPPASPAVAPAAAAPAGPILPVAFGEGGAVPLRTPSLVMRVWIAPWETDKGDLVMPGYVYSELTERRWMVGHTAVPTSTVLRPLEPPTRGQASSPADAVPRTLTPLPGPRGSEPDLREAVVRQEEENGGFFGPRPPVQATTPSTPRPAATPQAR